MCSAGDLTILTLGEGDPSQKALACRIPRRQSSCSLTQSVRSRWVRLSLRLSFCPCCCKLRLGMARLSSDIGSLDEPCPRFKPENEEQPIQIHVDLMLIIGFVIMLMLINNQSIVIIIIHYHLVLLYCYHRKNNCHHEIK